MGHIHGQLLRKDVEGINDKGVVEEKAIESRNSPWLEGTQHIEKDCLK